MCRAMACNCLSVLSGKRRGEPIGDALPIMGNPGESLSDNYFLSCCEKTDIVFDLFYYYHI